MKYTLLSNHIPGENVARTGCDDASVDGRRDREASKKLKYVLLRALRFVLQRNLPSRRLIH
jgi:hypothetical protein